MHVERVSVNNVSFRCGNVISNACNTTNISQLYSHIHTAVHSIQNDDDGISYACVCLQVFEIYCVYFLKFNDYIYCTIIKCTGTIHTIYRMDTSAMSNGET